MNIPQALGYTKIAGMPVVTGLYSLLLPLVGFAAFGSSRYLVVSADSATAAIFASGVSGMAPAASARYVALAGAVALLTAGFLLLARLLKLGFIADFLSQTVLVGFLTGVGFQVGIAVLGEMLGVEISASRTLLQLAQVFRRLPQVHAPTLAVSAVVVGVLLLFHRFAPRAPGAFIAVAGAIAASAIWNFSGRGIAIIGPVAGGLPHLGFPAVSWRDLSPLMRIAASCCIMIITQSAATARVYAARHRQQLDENADLAGLSAANAMAGLSGTFVVNGSPTQTAMVESAGAQSQVAQLATAAIVALVLLFLTRPLEYLPRCVLGALVFMIAIRLIKLRTLLAIRRESPGEFALALTTAGVVVAAGVEQGILLAMILSLLRIVRAQLSPPHGRHGSERARNLESESRGARRDDGTRIGAVPLWSGSFLCQCQPVCGRGDLSRRASAFASPLADCRRGGHHEFGLLRSARCPGIAAEPDELRNSIRLCPGTLGPASGLCPSSPHRIDRPFADLQPAS